MRVQNGTDPALDPNHLALLEESHAMARGNFTWFDGQRIRVLTSNAPVGVQLEVFWQHVVKSHGTGCWEFQIICPHHRYGQFLGYHAHVWLWELLNGPRPHVSEQQRRLSVCHTCDNPPCVRMDHLFLGTQADNIHDAIRKARMFTAEHRARAGERLRLYFAIHGHRPFKGSTMNI